MKIKIFFAVALLCLPLCGCQIYEDYESYEDNLAAVKADEEVGYISDIFSEPRFGKLSGEQRRVLESDFTEVNNITFIQQSNGRDVNIYESNKIKGAYVMYDGEWISTVMPIDARIKDCDELYGKLEKTAFAPVDFQRGYNGRNSVICTNREYAVMDYSNITPFSVLYPDVDVQVENMPIKVIVYENGGKAERIEIVSISSPYMEKLSSTNINDVKALFDELGLGEESAELAQEFGTSLDKGSYTRSDGAVSVRSSREVKRQRDTVYNVFTVNIG